MNNEYRLRFLMDSLLIITSATTDVKTWYEKFSPSEIKARNFRFVDQTVKCKKQI